MDREKNKYPLAFNRKSDGQLFIGRRTSGTDYVLVCTNTGLKEFVTQHWLRKLYVPSEKNKEVRKGNFRKIAIA